MIQIITQKSNLYCALDWGNTKHYYVIKENNTNVLAEGYIDNTPEGYAKLIQSLEHYRKERKVLLILEGTKACVVNALIQIDWIKLCPINPIKTKMLNNLDGSSKGKNDPRDAHLLCDYLILNSDKLEKTYIEKEQNIRNLRVLVNLEADLIAQATQLKQKIQAHINDFAPQLNQIIDDLSNPLYINYLLEFTPRQTIKHDKLENFLNKHRVHKKTKEKFIQQHNQIGLLSKQPSYQATQLRIIRTYVQVLKSILEQLKQCQQDIDQLFRQLPKAEIYLSMPGVGERLAPRLASLFGSEVSECFNHKKQVNAYFGQSPITLKSGNRTLVKKRFNCNDFARNTCFIWAQCVCMNRNSSWAKDYLNTLKDKGDKFPTRYRKLGAKLVPILYHCLVHNCTYDQDIYIKNSKNINKNN